MIAIGCDVIFIDISLGPVILFSILYSKIIDQLIRVIPLTKAQFKIVSEWQIFRTNALLLLSTRGSLTWGIWYSFLLQINVVIHYWIIGKALGFNIPLLNYFFLIPIQVVILMLPSINGIGLREVSSIVLFGYYGVAATEAAIFGFVDLAIMLVIGLIGWLRFLTRRSLSQNNDKVPATSSIPKIPD